MSVWPPASSGEMSSVAGSCLDNAKGP
jgi:hypothetical protein